MIAIPIDSKDSTTISTLFGKAPFFALLNTEVGDFTVIQNEVIGKGPKSAEFLKKHGVDSTIFYHMGEGVYKSFVDNSMDVYTADHKSLTLDEIYFEFFNNKFHKLDTTNFKELLDPGEGETCKCGCN